MNISEYELKNISFKANVDFCIAKDEWRKASITKFYNCEDKIWGLIVLNNGQEIGTFDLEILIQKGRLKVNNCKEYLPEYIRSLQNKNINPVYKTIKFQSSKHHFAYANMPDDIDEIIKYLDSRNITCLLHFSPICNLDSILKNGICSRDYCNSYNITFQHTDEKRLDDLKYLISLSISFPNYQMRHKKEKEMKQRFIIIEIDPSIIKKFGVCERRFCNMNAASTKIDKIIGPNLKHLKSMFSSESERKIRKLPLQYTTDPQAEVLLKGPIPVEYIKKIYFDNSRDFSYYFEKYHSPLFAMDRKFFTYRKEDYAYCSNNDEARKEDNTIWQEDLPF